MLKKIVDDKVSVLVSRGYGAGWYSWNRDFEQCLFHPELVELVELKVVLDAINIPYKDKYNPEFPVNVQKQNIISQIKKLASDLFGPKFYPDGADGLYIEQVYCKSMFYIKDFDGNESLVYLDINCDYNIITA